MTCQDALERIMEAEPATLRGDAAADPALAGHLRACGRCQAVAAVLVEELDALDAGLGDLARPRVPPRRRAVLAWVPLIAAAALAAVLLLGRDTTRAPVPIPGPEAVESAQPAGVAVTLPADRGGAIMSTNNPNITIVWLYQRSEQ